MEIIQTFSFQTLNFPLEKTKRQISCDNRSSRHAYCFTISRFVTIYTYQTLKNSVMLVDSSVCRGTGLQVLNDNTFYRVFQFTLPMSDSQCVHLIHYLTVWLIHYVQKGRSLPLGMTHSVGGVRYFISLGHTCNGNECVINMVGFPYFRYYQRF